MTQPSRVEHRVVRPHLRRIAGYAVILSFVLLPVLVAFTRIDLPAHPGEASRVQEAIFSEESDVHPLLLSFYSGTLPVDAAERWEADRGGVIRMARFGGMLSLFAVSGSLYLLLLLVRGRATAAMGCLALSLMPAVAQDGYILRPEYLTTTFGLLGIMLLAGLPVMLQRRRGGLVAGLSQLCVYTTVAVTCGIAAATLGNGWIYMTIPAGALFLSVASLAVIFPRATRDQSIVYWPFRAAARRYVPWMLTVLASMFAVVSARGDANEMVPRTHVESGLLPATPWLAVPLCAIAFVGAVRMGLGVSLRLGRLRRVRTDTVLFLYVAALLMQGLMMESGRDQLPAAAAFSCLVGDGALSTVLLVLGIRGKKRRASWVEPSVGR